MRVKAEAIKKTNFLQLLKSTQAPLLSVAILMIAHGYFLTFVSVRLEVEGYETNYLGIMHSLFYAGLLVSAVKIEPLIVRIGHIRAYASFAALMTITFLIQGMYLNIYLWIVLRFICGFSLASLYVIIESWILSNSHPKQRGKLLSLYMIALYASQAVSQTFLPLFPLTSALPYLFTGIFCIASILPLTLTYTLPPQLPTSSNISLKSLIFHSPFGCFGCFISGILISSAYGLAPSFAKDLSLSVPMLMGVLISGGFLLQWPIGHLSDLINRNTVLLSLSLFTLLPCLALSVFYKSPFLFYSAAFVFGGCSFALYPVSISRVCDRLKSEDITKATGVLVIAYGSGSVIGPALIGYLMRYLGPTSLFFSLGASALILFIVGILSSLYRESIALEEQVDYVSLPRTTPIAYELDPRENQEEQ